LELLSFVPFKVLSSTFYKLLPAVLPVLEAILECLFWNTAQLCQQIFFNLSTDLNYQPCVMNYSLVKRKKSAGARASGEYRGWGMSIILCFERKSQIRREECSRALS
jgi:hypothetical protein